jgi:hypothetical protein
MTVSQSELDRFYRAIARLGAGQLQGQKLASYSGRSALPKRGVYFFCEPGEYRTSNLGTSRIVRVGTHAISAGSSTSLWTRLRTHRGAVSGRGNHRGSIFRLHVGVALLAKNKRSLATWGIGSSANSEVRANEAVHEQLVSRYIGEMAVLWVDISDEPGANSIRAYVEKNAIALLSNQMSPLDLPSEGWLGRFSTHDEIQRSALWNLRHVDQIVDPKFLDAFDEIVSKTCKGLAR